MDESKIERLERLANSARLTVTYTAAELLEAEAALGLKKDALKAAVADLKSIVNDLKAASKHRN